jgi:hypothetical protein
MKIVGISGRKQAGKNTVANYINGVVLSNRGMISDFFIEQDGSLAISTKDNSGKVGYGIFDVTRKDQVFVEYAEKELWPYIKVYHFADPLKDLAINLFGLDSKLVYGSNDDKNQKTPFIWSDLPSGNASEENLTIREFLEYFGTSIIRKIKSDAWAEYTLKNILSDNSEIAIIPDVRFPNEVDAIKKAGGKVIRLTRDIFNSDFEAESALDKKNYDWNNFDLVIDNSNLDLNQLFETLKIYSHLWS